MNENTNGLLLQYFPKGTDLGARSVDDLPHWPRPLAKPLIKPVCPSVWQRGCTSRRGAPEVAQEEQDEYLLLVL